MKRKADTSEHGAPDVSNSEDNAPKKPRAAAKGKAKASPNEQDWPEYFQSVSASMVPLSCSWHLIWLECAKLFKVTFLLFYIPGLHVVERFILDL
jgi:hypothetical protein